MSNASDHLPEGADTKANHWLHTLVARGRCIASLGYIQNISNLNGLVV